MAWSSPLVLKSAPTHGHNLGEQTVPKEQAHQKNAFRHLGNCDPYGIFLLADLLAEEAAVNSNPKVR